MPAGRRGREVADHLAGPVGDGAEIERSISRRERRHMASTTATDPTVALIHEGWNHLMSQRPLAAWGTWQRALRLDPDSAAARQALETLESAPDLPPAVRRSTASGSRMAKRSGRGGTRRCGTGTTASWPRPRRRSAASRPRSRRMPTPGSTAVSAWPGRAGIRRPSSASTRW